MSIINTQEIRRCFTACKDSLNGKNCKCNPRIEELPEEQVKVKISTCPKCEGMVRCAVEHKMDKDSEKEFYKEVSKYKLNVKTIPLLEYRQNSPDWCECDS